MELNFQKSALNRCILKTNDLDEQANNLTNWQQSYDQMTDGCFKGSVEKLTSQSLHLFKEQTNRALRQQCQIWSDAVWFGIPVETFSMRMNGHELLPNGIALQVGDDAFELMTPENFEIYGIVLEADFLNALAYMQGIELRDLNCLQQNIVGLDPHKLASLKMALSILLGPNAQRMASHIREDILLSCLLQALLDKVTNSNCKPSFQHRKQVVERVKTYLESHAHLPVTIQELCQIAYVSRRTLQYSFESILGYSPLTFLKMTRLNQVKRALKNAPLESTVTEIAEFWGFTHAGQFSKDYKKAFGELPSETLKKSSV